MDLLDLPVEIISAVIDQLVLSCDLRAGLHLRHVNRKSPNNTYNRNRP
jgi:hypothetical protein